MPHSRIDGPNRRRQPGTAVGENQTQCSAFQSASVEILQQGFPVRLPFALATQESQQVTAAVAPDAIRHQHLDLLASRRPSHPQAHSVQKKVGVVVVQPRLMKLAYRFIQIPRQLRYRLRAYGLASDGGHHSPHLPGRDPAQKRFPDQQRNFFGPPLKSPQPHRQKTLFPGARNTQPDRAEPGHEIPLVIAVAVDASLPPPSLIPSPAGIPVALPFRLQLDKPLPRPSRLPVQLPPETLFPLRLKVLEMLADRD